MIRTRKILACCALAAALPTATYAAEGIRVKGHSAVADLTAGTATFSIYFNTAPDFESLNPQGGQQQAFQFWTDSEAPDPIGRTYDGLLGGIPVGTTTVINGNEMYKTGQLEVIWTKPLTWSGPWSSGGWGEVVGYTDYSVSATSTLSFTLPLAALHDDDGRFYYSFQFSSPSTSGIFDGQSMLVAEVPEPGTYAMLLAGLGIVGFSMRKRQASA